MKTKDYIFISLATVISIVIFFIALAICSLAGMFGMVIARGVFGLLAGTIFVYICYNYPKTWIFTLYTFILVLVQALMGETYFLWIILYLVSAVVADIILNIFGFDKLLPQAAAWSLMTIGSMIGQWIPVWFFADSFKKYFVERGQTIELMNQFIYFSQGIWGIAAVLITAILPIIGVLIGRTILRKYQK